MKSHNPKYVLAPSSPRCATKYLLGLLGSVGHVVTLAIVGAAFTLGLLTLRPAEAQDAPVIRDFILARAVVDREPVGMTESFSLADGRAFAFARLHNTGSPTMVFFVWQYGEAVYAAVPMNVGVSPGWRTWSSVRLRPGEWHVELVTIDGLVLAEAAFTVGQ